MMLSPVFPAIFHYRQRIDIIQRVEQEVRICLHFQKRQLGLQFLVLQFFPDLFLQGTRRLAADRQKAIKIMREYSTY